MKRIGLALSIYALAAYLFLHLPLLILGRFSFNQSRFTVWEGFSLHWYAAAFQDTQLMEGRMEQPDHRAWSPHSFRR